MKIDEAKKWIEENGGKEFSIKFVKKDNTIRIMNCKTGVIDNNLLVKNPYNPGINFKALGLISVYDTDKSLYRCFNPKSLLAIKINDVWQSIDNPEKAIINQTNG